MAFGVLRAVSGFRWYFGITEMLGIDVEQCSWSHGRACYISGDGGAVGSKKAKKRQNKANASLPSEQGSG